MLLSQRQKGNQLKRNLDDDDDVDVGKTKRKVVSSVILKKNDNDK